MIQQADFGVRFEKRDHRRYGRSHWLHYNVTQPAAHLPRLALSPACLGVNSPAKQPAEVAESFPQKSGGGPGCIRVFDTWQHVHFARSETDRAPQAMEINLGSPGRKYKSFLIQAAKLPLSAPSSSSSLRFRSSPPP